MSFTREETSLRHFRKCISIIEVKAVPFERRELPLSDALEVGAIDLEYIEITLTYINVKPYTVT